MKYRYTGPADVTAIVSGGPEALRRWRDRAADRSDGKVWLADTPGCDVWLALSDDAIDDASRWQGEAFTGDAGMVQVVVDAADALDCGARLTEDLFDFFPGQSEIGEAHFPIDTVSQPARGKAGRVLVVQIDKGRARAEAIAGAFGEDALVLRIDPAESARVLNWRSEDA